MKNPVTALSFLSRQQLAVGAFLSVLPVLSLAYEGTALMRVAVLALPIMLLLWWAHPNKASIRRVQLAASLLIALMFLIDGVVRGFLLQAFSAAPDSTMVMTALANTTPAEPGEFFDSHWSRFMGWKLAFLASLALHGLFLWSWWFASEGKSHTNKKLSAALLVFSLVFVLAVALKPWRGFHPLVFWPNLLSGLEEMNQDWADLETQRAVLKQRAQDSAPVLTSSSPDTVVLVISDSINRHHPSLYSYPRQTTPRLEARLRLEPDTFKVFSHAWSADASTVPALQNLFYFAKPDDDQRNHLLSLASAAGYQTTWISNQDDRAIHHEHAKLADRVHMLNNVPGRSTASLDHQVLPALEEALRSGAERQFIVVHLLGAHPHYSSRYPEDLPVFEDAKDKIDESLKNEGRSFWTRKLRNKYDSALHFHDTIVSSSLDLAKRWGGKNTAWIYFSDHGQEVGGNGNRVGHSATSADGYRIPLIMWGSVTKPLSEESRKTPIRADWLGHSVMRLLDLKWPGHRPERDFMDPAYRWHQPANHPAKLDPLS